MPPLEIAQAFAMETTYNPAAVGSHACWKFLQQQRSRRPFQSTSPQRLAMANALRQAS